MVSEADVRVALSARLASLVMSPVLPVYSENNEIDEGGSAWLETQLFRSSNDPFGLGGEHRHSGFFQIALVRPQGAGAPTSDRVADLVAAHFPKDLKLVSGSTTIRVTATPTVAGGYQDGNKWRVPISVYYEAWD